MTQMKLPDSTDMRIDSRTLTLRVGYTPDSDDVFNYYAWEQGHVWLPGYAAEFEQEHIIALNRAAMRGGEFDVVNVSSVIYPSVADNYCILAVGTSVGRGYGPVLVSKHYHRLADLAGKRIACGGIPTTGAMLAMMFCPGSAELTEMRYDAIADAIVAGEVDAGVMIHEELVYFPEKGLHAIADLGAKWCQSNRLPLPVGLNLVRRDLGRVLAREIARTCGDSLRWAQTHAEEACAYANSFGRGRAQQFVAMFSNQDTLCMPADVRRALRVLFGQLAQLGVAPAIEQIEVIDE
jgi:1,4-dihydroxy-6-naphthoate synthase